MGRYHSLCGDWLIQVSGFIDCHLSTVVHRFTVEDDVLVVVAAVVMFISLYYYHYCIMSPPLFFHCLFWQSLSLVYWTLMQ
mmetsp:Transcript_10802/g.9849  ORF Transcript_10802/g.9849 Transcript_10802/m.9849 type:complete len:81 (-) Transcript_10802:85-327(-)